ncbi:MAG: diguanylate cyclase [Azonexus sp.]|jgi:GGDEF domain-containing protein|nr:diguanylate cyclase [Azonexus sp.]
MSDAPKLPDRSAGTVNTSGSMAALLGLFVIAGAECQRLWPSGTSLIYLAICLPLLLIWIAHLAGWRLAESNAGLAVDLAIYVLIVASLGIRFGSSPQKGSELASTLLFWSPLVAAWWAWRYRDFPRKLGILLGGFFVVLTWQLAGAHEQFHQHLILSVLVALVVRYASRQAATSGLAMTLRDPLTGLPSPECFEAELAHVSAISDRYRFPLTLIGCRLAPALTGPQLDRLLCQYAEAIADRLRTSDTACHWSATTFFLLLPNTAEKEAWIVANGILESTGNFDFGQKNRPTVAFRVISHQAGEDPMSTLSALENQLADAIE